MNRLPNEMRRKWLKWRNENLFFMILMEQDARAREQ